MVRSSSNQLYGLGETAELRFLLLNFEWAGGRDGRTRTGDGRLDLRLAVSKELGGPGEDGEILSSFSLPAMLPPASNALSIRSSRAVNLGQVPLEIICRGTNQKALLASIKAAAGAHSFWKNGSATSRRLQRKSTCRRLTQTQQGSSSHAR
jgi:hypothetical protein